MLSCGHDLWMISRWPESVTALSGIFARVGGTVNHEGMQCGHSVIGSSFVLDEPDGSLTFWPSAQQDNSLRLLHVTLVLEVMPLVFLCAHVG